MSFCYKAFLLGCTPSSVLPSLPLLHPTTSFGCSTAPTPPLRSQIPTCPHACLHMFPNMTQ